MKTFYLKQTKFWKDNWKRVDIVRRGLLYKIIFKEKKLNNNIYNILERLNRKLVYVLPFVERQLDTVNHLLKEIWLKHSPCNRTYPIYRQNIELVLYTPRVLGKTPESHEEFSNQLKKVCVFV